METPFYQRREPPSDYAAGTSGTDYGTVSHSMPAIQSPNTITNPWNQFQHDNQGTYTREELSRAYGQQRAQSTSSTHYLHRPYLRNSTTSGITRGRGINGTFFDANTGMPITGTPDVGHVYGHEFWRERDSAEGTGMTQAQFNDYMNNSAFYQFEDPSSNRSHRFEMK